MQRIGPYQIVEEIARGGMGVVFRAKQPDTDRDVAVKLMLGGGFATPTTRERFAREAKALRKVRHPGVVRVFDSDVTPEGLPYMAMEFVQGESLQERLNRDGSLSISEATAVTRRLCEAIVACHTADVLHRDLKPDNVLVESFGAIKLTDFGLARDLEDSTRRTRLSVAGQFLGTPGYWAPEQAAGELEDIGIRTDVYGLGAVLFALLTGRPPCAGESLIEILSNVREPKPVPSTLNPQVPAWLDAVVAKALATDPAQRYPNAWALSEALKAPRGADPEDRPLALADLPSKAFLPKAVLHEPDAPHEDTDRPLPLAVPTLFAAGVLASVVVGLAMSTRSATPAPPAPRDVADDRSVKPQINVPEAQASTHIAAGDAKAKAGDDPGAIVAYGKAIDLAPDSAQGYLRRARALTRLRRHDEALRDAIVATRRDLTSARALVLRALLRIRTHGERDRALSDVERALSLEPALGEAFAVRAYALLDRDAMGRLRSERATARRARADADQALRLDPSLALAHQVRAETLARETKFRSGLEAIDRALELEPRSTEALLVRAILHLNLEDGPATLDDLDAILALDPNHAVALALKANVLMLKKRAGKAVPLLERAIASDPNLFYGHYLMGLTRLQRARPDFELAIAEFSTAIGFEPSYGHSYFYRALARTQLARYEQALEDLDAIARLKPRSTSDFPPRVSRHQLRGEIHYHRREWALAREAFQKILTEKPEADSHPRSREWIRRCDAKLAGD